MKSFRTELEDPIVEKDIIELERKIRLFHEGKIDEERFRSLRLARGVYGQRQLGVQMIRIKLPYGKVTSEQLLRIADVSDEFSTGRLHITTRQDIQIHHVSLDRTPELWAQLEQDDITLREACGNTVRNVTASPTAGVDVDEPFDVTPYAHAVFQFFLRNPVCQEMGRKFKISFSATEKDDALSFMHDLGFLAKTQTNGEKTVRGFKVMLAGGLGSQPSHAETLYEFLEEQYLIPVIESVVRVFDRYGEREKRNKARLKFLVKEIGLEAFIGLIEEQKRALPQQTLAIDTAGFETALPPDLEVPQVNLENGEEFEAWKHTNVIRQKQPGLVAVGIKVHLGDFYTDKARKLAHLIKTFAANELRFTLRQDILIRHVREELLPFFYQELKALGFAESGYDTIADITACPGTDTCNLGIASSTGIAAELQKVINTEYPQFATNKELTIKISGCMNACGQHSMAHIGFQGMSIKSGVRLAPGLQVLLGGGVLGNGQGRFADKVIKVPSKRGPEALRVLLDDFGQHQQIDESFLNYYDRQGKNYFYELLKHLAQTDNLVDGDFVDWGHQADYVKAIGVGECAGVVIDLVATLLFESEEKLENANEALKQEKWADAIYHAYTALINTAKAQLVADQMRTNSQASIIKGFDEKYVATGEISLQSGTFANLVNQMNEQAPSEEFATQYLQDARSFYHLIDQVRAKSLVHA